MLKNLITKWWPEKPSPLTLSPEFEAYASKAYPSNHTYKVRKGKLLPLRQLAARYKKISSLFPQPLTSFLDIGCSKGYFVFAAAMQNQCERSLGIDITDYDIQFCRHIKSAINSESARFEVLKLHELAENIQCYGGSFQTLLVINQYQYLYFGSDRCDSRYLDHHKIFSYLRSICHGRVIFNNRLQLEAVQNDKWVKIAGNKALEYSAEKIKNAASHFFQVSEHGSIGKYPLLTLDAY